jgi:Ni,Fe-hydrogenase III small subunit/formate hydrogenlyase subunit 6/NADH:ubiquinone oxidoreductase subunit I
MRLGWLLGCWAAIHQDHIFCRCMPARYHAVSTDDVRIYRFDASGCNGCDVAILEMATSAPLHRLGIQIAETPDEANLLLITGGANQKAAGELAAVHRRIGEPRRVVAVGSCATTLGIFKGSSVMAGPIDGIVPVDLWIAGCPPRPQTLLLALAEALQIRLEGLTPLPPSPGYRGEPQVDPSRCMGCGACAHVCPADAIALGDAGAERLVRFSRGDCISCASCQDACPSQAILLSASEPVWFTDKGTGASRTSVALAVCPACGKPCIPAPQIQWVMRKLEEARKRDGAVPAGVGRRLAVCPACRRTRVAEVTEAKRLLAAMARAPLA